MATATEFVPKQHETEAVTAHVIWMTTGLSCDGDSVAMTSATEPSLEDIVTGTIPGMPKVVVHNPVLAFENGAEFMQAWYDAEAGKLDPFVLVVEGSIPNEKINGEGYWAGDRRRPRDRAADHHQRVGRPPGAEGGGRGGRGHLRHLRRHPRHEEQPDGRDGPAGLPRLELEVRGRPARRLHPRLPRPAGQHDRDADVPRVPPRGHGSGPRAGRGAAAQVAVRAHGARELQPRRLRRGGPVRHRVRRRPALPGQAGLQGAGGASATCRCAAGSRARAAAPTWAASAWPARCPASPTSTCRSWSRTGWGNMAVELPEVRLRPDGDAASGTGNIKNKYDKEPEWRHNRGELTTGYAKRW